MYTAAFSPAVPFFVNSLSLVLNKFLPHASVAAASATAGVVLMSACYCCCLPNSAKVSASQAAGSKAVSGGTCRHASPAWPCPWGQCRHVLLLPLKRQSSCDTGKWPWVVTMSTQVCPMQQTRTHSPLLPPATNSREFTPPMEYLHH